MSFLYSNGVVASQSENLINKETFARMIDAKDFLEAKEILLESPFSRYCEENESINVSLDKCFKSIFDFVRNESPDEQTKKFFLSPFDFDNIAIYCKTKLLNIQDEDFYEYKGLFKIGDIKNSIKTRDTSVFNDDLIEEMLKHYFNALETNNFKYWEADAFFKKYKYRYLKKQCLNKVLSKLVNIMLDTQNLSICLRENNENKFNAQRVVCGNINNKLLEKIFKRDEEALYEIEDEDVKKLVECVYSNNKEKALIKFNYLTNIILLKKARLFSSDVESSGPFVYYVLSRITELKNIRLILSFKQNDIDEKLDSRFLEID